MKCELPHATHRRFLVDEPVKLGGKGIGESGAHDLAGRDMAEAHQRPHSLLPDPAHRPQPAVGAARLPGGLHPVHLHHDCQGDETGRPGGGRLVCRRWVGGGAVWVGEPAALVVPCAVDSFILPSHLQTSLLSGCFCQPAVTACPCPPCPATCPPGEYDLRGVHGEPGVDARFQRIQLQGTFDGPLSQGDLDRIAEQVGGGGWRLVSSCKHEPKQSGGRPVPSLPLVGRHGARKCEQDVCAP